jgi:hypothetical protein
MYDCFNVCNFYLVYINLSYDIVCVICSVNLCVHYVSHEKAKATQKVEQTETAPPVTVEGHKTRQRRTSTEGVATAATTKPKKS